VQGLAIGFVVGLGAQILVFGAASSSDQGDWAILLTPLPVVGACLAGGLLRFTGWFGAVVGTVVAWPLAATLSSVTVVNDSSEAVLWFALLMLPIAFIAGLVVAAIRDDKF
jgi:hypothetical protein